jgi:phage repressor protein C with HTH and peptisase S24 domain
MRHEDVWRAIDALAAEHGLSASGLARKAGLDPTAFNPSKRTGPDGRARWPSTESVAKVLTATGTGIDAFASLVTGAPALSRGRALSGRRIPLIGLAQAGGEGYFDDGGYPVGGGWDEIAVPDVPDPNAYALEISGDSMEPVFRKGEVMAKELLRQSARRVELASLNPAHPGYSFGLDELAFMHRIVWASQ